MPARAGRRAAGSSRLWPVLLAALLLAAGCSSSPTWEHNPAVRRAVLDQLSGFQAHELIVRRDEGEPRQALRGPWEATVWVTAGLREEEYLSTRDPLRNFLYLGRVDYDGAFSQAVVLVRLGRGAEQPEERVLVLERRGDHWLVTEERSP